MKLRDTHILAGTNVNKKILKIMGITANRLELGKKRALLIYLLAFYIDNIM
jgi:hypothetical protein